MIAGMNIPPVLWARQREVFLYDCEAYRVWMVRSGRESQARSYAEFPVAIYISIVMCGIVLALGDLASHFDWLAWLILFLLAAAMAHVFLRSRWEEAGAVYAKYLPVPYWLHTIVAGSIVVTLFMSLAVFTLYPLLTPVILAVHWLVIGTFYHALLSRRRITTAAGSGVRPVE
jgi:hypothetical protein